MLKHTYGRTACAMISSAVIPSRCLSTSLRCFKYPGIDTRHTSAVGRVVRCDIDNMILPLRNKHDKSFAFMNLCKTLDSALSCKRSYTTEYNYKHTCWKCGIDLQPLKEQYFCECGMIQPPNRSRHYFDVLCVPLQYDIDEMLMGSNYKNLQKLLHPDNFFGKSKVTIIV